MIDPQFSLVTLPLPALWRRPTRVNLSIWNDSIRGNRFDTQPCPSPPARSAEWGEINCEEQTHSLNLGRESLSRTQPGWDSPAEMLCFICLCSCHKWTPLGHPQGQKGQAYCHLHCKMGLVLPRSGWQLCCQANRTGSQT